jgi:hypothetical protein
MFSCRSCLRRHISDFLKGSILLTKGQTSAFVPQYATLGTRSTRGNSTVAATAETGELESTVWERPDHKTIHKSPARSRRPQNGTNVPSREQWLQSRGKRPSTKPRKLPTASATQKELVWLGDPLKLANHVLRLLSDDKFEEAENLVRTASKSNQCTVSWNHLVNWQLSRGKVNAAVKTYNEVSLLLPSLIT